MDQLRQDEHEKYFFGNSSSEIYFTLEQVLRKTMSDLMESCKEVLIEENVCADTMKIDKEITELETLYVDNCSKVLLNFKSILKDIFSIPTNAPIYKKSEMTTSDTYTEEDIETLKQTVKNLEEEILRKKKFLEHLKKEKEIIEKLRFIYETTKVRLEKLKSIKNNDCEHILDKINEKLEHFCKKLNLDENILMELSEDLGS